MNMKRKSIIFLTMILTVIFSAIASSYIVNADELDGYTKVDWSWNRDMETTDVNSVIVGGNIPFCLPEAFRSLSRLSSALSAKASTLRSY